MAKRQRTNNHLEVEDTTGAIRIRKSKKDRQCSGQKKKIKRTNNGLQNTTHETKDPSTRTTPLNTRCELKCSEGYSVPVSLCTLLDVVEKTCTNGFLEIE